LSAATNKIYCPVIHVNRIYTECSKEKQPHKEFCLFLCGPPP